MKKVILTTCLIATVLMNFTSGYTSNMTATADYETPIVTEGAYTSTVEDTIEETTTPIETAPTEVQITETQNTESVETTSTEATDSTETTTTEIQTTEPIETTVVEETTITSIAETTTTETTTTYIVGDADENGKLNVRDAAFIAKALANKEADTLPESADYTEDNKIDVRDAAAIARHLASRYNEEPVVTSVSNDISVGVTTSTHIAHYRPAESCTCVTDEDTELCPLCGIPMDCTCGLDVTTTSTSNEDETTTTTAVGNDDTTTTTTVGYEDAITTVQTAETINTLPVETTAVIPTTTTTVTTTNRSNASTSVEITTDPSTTTTYTITTITAEHKHVYIAETEIVEHEAEYQTKTVWMLSPDMYEDPDWVTVCGYGENRYFPEGFLEEYPYSSYPGHAYNRANEYDILCHFEDKSWDELVKTYRDDFDHFRAYIDKNNFEDYGITEEQWYDADYMRTHPFKFYNEQWNMWGDNCYIGYSDNWGYDQPEFNPELDSICIVNYQGWLEPWLNYARANVEELYRNNCSHMTAENKFLPVAQETVLVEDAWTEIVTHEVCECGHTK